MNLSERPLVSVVDDDESVRESLPDLLRKLALRLGLSRLPKSFSRPIRLMRPNA